MGFLDKAKGTARPAMNVKVDPDDPQSVLVWGAAS